ncbi:VOC family protein [Microbacterium album]|uniref:VOC domain-containing protein n=1 Tax=Microbacterium album TaxID=2053191 RepID=A0A917IGS3_9MICO|nr:VOC family protein [Microbacterium album]GGH48383.1 hypothetical protein GCM10010921_25800 [Microbacterium album]
MSALNPELSFDHVGLNVDDLEKATEWYSTTFGLEVAPTVTLPSGLVRVSVLRHPQQDWRVELLSREGAQQGIQASDPEDAVRTLGFSHFALRVDDVQAYYDYLLTRGCTERMSPRTVARPGTLVSYVADPWGNLIEVLNRV